MEDRWWPQTPKQEEDKISKNKPRTSVTWKKRKMNTQKLAEVFLVGVGTEPHLENTPGLHVLALVLLLLLLYVIVSQKSTPSSAQPI